MPPNAPVLSPLVTRYEDAVSGTCDFEGQESVQVLLQLMGEYPAVSIVLDALDEVNQEDRQELLDILSQLRTMRTSSSRVFGHA